MEVDGGSQDNGVSVIQQSLHRGNNQKFDVFSVGNGYYSLRAVHSNKVLDVQGNSTEQNTPIHQYEENNTDAQKFALEPTNDGYRIRGKHSQLLVMPYTGSRDKGIHLVQGNTNTEDGVWYFEPANARAKRSKTTAVSNLNLFPNPAKDILNVAYNYSGKTAASVRVLDMQGRVVQEIKSDKVDVATREFQIDTSYLNSVYVYTIYADRSR